MYGSLYFSLLGMYQVLGIYVGKGLANEMRKYNMFPLKSELNKKGSWTIAQYITNIYICIYIYI